MTSSSTHTTPTSGPGRWSGSRPPTSERRSIPDLGVVVGKQGYVYLLNMQNLGGFEQGAGGGDAVVQRLGPFGGVWGRAGVWPGDGGYVYLPTSTGQSGGGLFDVYHYGLTGSGAPSLSAAGSAANTFGWGSGSPVITSDGSISGSALVWIIWSADRTGANAQLLAYNPVPVDGTLQQVFDASIGTSTNYSLPGVGNNGDLYVGTRNGKVLAFGSPVTEPISGSPLSFAATVTGTSSTPQTLTLTANEPVSVTAISSSSSQFTVGTPSAALPAPLANSGDTISVPISFSPSQVGPVGGDVTIATDSGTVSVPVSGTGESAAPELIADTRLLSLGGTTVGNTLSGTVTFSNTGVGPLTISSVVLPGAPFTAVGAPAAGDQIASGHSVTVEVDFNPTVDGQFSDSIELRSDGGNVTIGLSGSASLPSHLVVSSTSTDFGEVAVGTTATKTFTLTNDGGSDLTINKSKPPFGGEFSPVSALPEGTTVSPGQTLTETVAFTPTTAGAATGNWQITADDGTGLHQVDFTGTGVAPPVTTGTTTTTTPTSTTTTPTTTTTTATTTTTPVSITRAPKMPGTPTFSPSVLSGGAISRAYITYSAALRAVARFTLERAIHGRRSGGRCIGPTARDGHLKPCVRWVTVASFTHADAIGVNRLKLIRLVAPAQLSPGTYRLRSVLEDSFGNPVAFITELIIKPA